MHDFSSMKMYQSLFWNRNKIATVYLVYGCPWGECPSNICGHLISSRPTRFPSCIINPSGLHPSPGYCGLTQNPLSHTQTFWSFLAFLYASRAHFSFSWPYAMAVVCILWPHDVLFSKLNIPLNVEVFANSLLFDAVILSARAACHCGLSLWPAVPST